MIDEIIMNCDFFLFHHDVIPILIYFKRCLHTIHRTHTHTFRNLTCLILCMLDWLCEIQGKINMHTLSSMQIVCWKCSTVAAGLVARLLVYVRFWILNFEREREKNQQLKNVTYHPVALVCLHLMCVRATWHFAYIFLKLYIHFLLLLLLLSSQQS